MHTQPDFEDFLRLLESNRVDYMVVGAFAEARGGVVRGRYGAVDVTFIGRDDLVRNKRASGRHRDLGDVEELAGPTD